MKNSISKASLQVVIIVFVIKFFGVIKQSVIASFCGSTKETDVYFVATSIIIALCSAFFSALSISFLSMYTNVVVKKNKIEANKLLSSVLKVFLPVSFIIAIIFMILAQPISSFIAPTYTIEESNLLTSYIRLMSIMFVFSCYYLIINVVLETNKNFLPGKSQSLFQNLFIIIATVFFYKKYGMITLVFALVLAGFVQCIQITWSARKYLNFYNTKVKKHNQEINKLLMISFPLIVGNAIYEINDIVDKRIALSLSDGGVSNLTFGASINEIVTTMIVASLSTVLFAHFSEWIAEGDKKRVSTCLLKSFEALLLIIMPIAIMCFACSDCIVSVLYGRGDFGTSNILMTANVVVGYAVGFFFQATRANIVKVYYAFQDTKLPMINGAITVCINICLSLILSKVFGIGGIALATSLSMMISTILLLPHLCKYLPDFSLKSSYKEYLKIILCSLVVGIGAMIVRKNIKMGAFITLLILGLFVVATYTILILLMKVKCIKDLKYK